MKRAEAALAECARVAGAELADVAAFVAGEHELTAEFDALVKEVDELLLHADGLNVLVPIAVPLRIGRWRLALRAGRTGSKKLASLQRLVQEAEELCLVHTAPGAEQPSSSAGAEAEAPAGAAEGVQPGSQPERPPSRTSQRRSARAASPAASSSPAASLVEGAAPALEDKARCGPPSASELGLSEEVGLEMDKAGRELGMLTRLVSQCEAWEEEATSMLESGAVHVESLEALLRRGDALPIATEARNYLAATFADANKWAAQAKGLAAPDARLEDVQRLLKDFNKANLLSEAVADLRTRAAEGEAWLAALKTLFEGCGIELDNVARVLESDGAPLYCVCRQPDDLRRLMLACDGCEIWYHMHCVGVPPAKVKAMANNNDEFECPACAARKGASYKFEPRCRRAPPKDTPRVAAVAALLQRADALRVHVDDAVALRRAHEAALAWQAASVPTLLSALPLSALAQLRSNGNGGAGSSSNSSTNGEGERPLWACVSESLQRELYESGEELRVEPELMTLLKAWRVRRRLHAARGSPCFNAEGDDAAGEGAAAEPELEAPAGASAEAGPGLLLSDKASLLECTETGLSANKPALPRVVTVQPRPQPRQAGLEMAELKSILEEAVDAGVAQLEEERRTAKTSRGGASSALAAESSATVKTEGPVVFGCGAWEGLFARELAAVEADVSEARALVDEAERWLKEASALAKSASPVDPAALASLVERARSSALKLPQLPLLEERAARVSKWASTAEALLQRAEAGGASGGVQGGVALDELVRVHAEGLRLRVMGETWETLLSTLAAVGRGIQGVRTSLVHFSDAQTTLDAVADLRGLGVGLVVDAALREIVLGLQPPVAPAPAPQQLAVGMGGRGGTGAGSFAFAQGSPTQQPQQMHAQGQQGAPSGVAGMPGAAVPVGGPAMQQLVWAPAPPQGPPSRAAQQSAGRSAAAAAAEPQMSTGLHGLPARSVAGARLRVYYEEDGVLVGYDGLAEAADAAKGLKVRLDGFSKREWLTDEDEWEWVDGAGGPSGPWPLERTYGAALRTWLAKLAKALEKLDGLARAAEAPPPGKGGKRGSSGAEGGARKRVKGEPGVRGPGKAKKEAAAVAAKAAAAAQEDGEDGGGKRRKALGS